MVNGKPKMMSDMFPDGHASVDPMDPGPPPEPNDFMNLGDLSDMGGMMMDSPPPPAPFPAPLDPLTTPTPPVPGPPEQGLVAPNPQFDPLAALTARFRRNP